MPKLSLRDVSVDFPIYDASSRSLKKSVMNRGTGGRLCADARNRVWVQALRDVTVTLNDGDRVGLIGHNGAGKTTLLRVLAGVYEPTRGTVIREGRVVPLFDVSLGMDMDSTGYENIILRGLFMGEMPDTMKAKFDDIATFTGLGDYLDMPVRTYSSGMRLRLAFAASTCIVPEVLLMDEWVAVSDIAFLDHAETRLRALVNRSALMVLASHSDAIIRQHCDKALLMHQGCVVGFGPVEEMLDRYHASVFDGVPQSAAVGEVA
jgi:ABC-2 type transport system ATP-binding protein/lipopolysaccharide transport system ATP-binding protein